MPCVTAVVCVKVSAAKHNIIKNDSVDAANTPACPTQPATWHGLQGQSCHPQVEGCRQPALWDHMTSLTSSKTQGEEKSASSSLGFSAKPCDLEFAQ
eukprot:4912106-Amphidinium_carterae.1